MYKNLSNHPKVHKNLYVSFSIVHKNLETILKLHKNPKIAFSKVHKNLSSYPKSAQKSIDIILKSAQKIILKVHKNL